MPKSAGNKEDFTGMQAEAHGDGLSEQRELREIGIFDIRNLRGIVLVGMHINEVRLIFGESGVFLDAVDLDEKGVGVIAVEMEEREFSAAATNKKFRGAVMEPRTQNPAKLAVEPVGEEIRRLGVDIREKLRPKVFKNGVAEVWSGFGGVEEVTWSMKSAMVYFLPSMVRFLVPNLDLK